MPRAVALAAYPTARQLPSAASRCSTGLGAESVPPRAARSSEAMGAKARTFASLRNPPSHVTEARHGVAFAGVASHRGPLEAGLA